MGNAFSTQKKKQDHKKKQQDWTEKSDRHDQSRAKHVMTCCTRCKNIVGTRNDELSFDVFINWRQDLSTTPTLSDNWTRPRSLLHLIKLVEIVL